MKEGAISFSSELAGLDQVAWRDRLLEIGDALGSAEKLTDKLSAIHLEAGPKLLVTFENGEILRRTAKDAEPIGFSYTRRDGWSTLAIVASGSSYFRDQELFAYFDRLTDEGFFDAYEKVVFFGEQAGGHAACAYSVAAPGSTVLALSPFSTMTPEIAGFDSRLRHAKSLDFTSRYGFAPAMIDAAEDVYLVYCPSHRNEAIHASIFIRDHVTRLKAFGSPLGMGAMLTEMDILEDLIRAAMAGSLTKTVFADQYRARRENAKYLNAMLSRAMERGHTRLAAQACKIALRYVDDPGIKAMLAETGEEPSPPQSHAAQ